MDIAVTAAVIVVGIVVAQGVMIMGTVVGLRGALHTEVAAIILQGARLIAKGQEGRGLGHFHILLTTAQSQTGSTREDLDD